MRARESANRLSVCDYHIANSNSSSSSAVSATAAVGSVAVRRSDGIVRSVRQRVSLLFCCCRVAMSMCLCVYLAVCITRSAANVIVIIITVRRERQNTRNRLSPAAPRSAERIEPIVIVDVIIAWIVEVDEEHVGMHGPPVVDGDELEGVAVHARNRRGKACAEKERRGERASDGDGRLHRTAQLRTEDADFQFISIDITSNSVDSIDIMIAVTLVILIIAVIVAVQMIRIDAMRAMAVF